MISKKKTTLVVIILVILLGLLFSINFILTKVKINSYFSEVFACEFHKIKIYRNLNRDVAGREFITAKNIQAENLSQQLIDILKNNALNIENSYIDDVIYTSVVLMDKDEKKIELQFMIGVNKSYVNVMKGSKFTLIVLNRKGAEQMHFFLETLLRQNEQGGFETDNEKTI